MGSAVLAKKRTGEIMKALSKAQTRAIIMALNNGGSCRPCGHGARGFSSTVESLIKLGLAHRELRDSCRLTLTRAGSLAATQADKKTTN